MTVKYTEISYCGAKVKVAKVPKKGFIIHGSVDGNRYDKPYASTVPSGFSDKSLLASGYTEEIAGNGSIFYYYNIQCFAEGLEVVQGGVNNQDFNMSCVSNFNEHMAIGFLKNGGLVFDKQINLIHNISKYYSAITFCFGIMKDGKKAEWGKEKAEEYSIISGRTILGQNDDYVFALSVVGTSGKSGLYGHQLFALCQELGMLDAGCFDGGGSTWLRVNGEYKDNSDRKVKNAWMIFSKPTSEPKPEKKEEQADEPITGDSSIVLHVASIGMYVRKTLEYNAKKKASGQIIATVKVGEKAEVLEFIDGIQPDGYQWVKVKYGNITGYSQYDSQCYWLERRG